MRRFALLTILFAAPLGAQSYYDGAAFLTHASQAGPESPESRVFSTNWFTAGYDHRSSDFTFSARGTISLEPFTIPEEGYPQVLQYAPPLVDHMRALDFVQEAAIAIRWRALGLYLAPVGEPPLGAEPFEQRSSSVDFAEAPFAYDVQESFHVGTRVIAAGIGTRAVAIEGGVFHASQTTGNHSSIDDGDIDSWGARLTIAPEGKLSAQISAGQLTDANTSITSASVTYTGSVFATSGLWTKRESEMAYGLETSIRPGRSTILGRVEWVDRPAGVFTVADKTMAHVTAGYIFDIFRTPKQRAGVGVNIDYHSNTKQLIRDYGHKPQGIYIFVRWRTEGVTRRASL
jgi:hypothetical protein